MLKAAQMAMPRMRYLITRIAAMPAATLGPDRDAAKNISVEGAERTGAWRVGIPLGRNNCAIGGALAHGASEVGPSGAAVSTSITAF